MTNDLSKFFQTGKCPSLEELVEEMDYAGFNVLKKLVLSGTEVRKFRQLLDREGTTEAHLMPTLDRVASTVKDRWMRSKTL